MPTAAILLTVLLGADTSGPIDFDTQIVPVLTTSGCNAGSCHGSAAGRGGFKLSLYGSDPAADFQAIARQMEDSEPGSDVVPHVGNRHVEDEVVDDLVLLELTQQCAV